MSISRFRITVGALALLGAAACSSDDSTGPSGPPPTGKALVLITYGEPGLSVVPDTGTAARHIGFGDTFDGATFTVRHDTVLSTSSKFGGDELFVANVATGATRVIGLPAGSNPAGAIFVDGTVRGATGARYAVALRDDSTIALVNDAGQATLVRNAGTCPYDVVVVRGSLWSVDSNQNCADWYQSLGPVRLIRTPVDSAVRDTITLNDAVRGSSRAFVFGDVAVIVSSGDWMGREGAIVSVNLATRTVLGRLPLPAGVYAVAARVGLDGHLYVTGSAGFDPYAPRVYKVDLTSLAYVGRRATNERYLDLRENGALVRCDAASADRDGTVYCVENRDVTNRLLVFAPDGTIERQVVTNGLGADVVVR